MYKPGDIVYHAYEDLVYKIILKEKGDGGWTIQWVDPVSPRAKERTKRGHVHGSTTEWMEEYFVSEQVYNSKLYRLLDGDCET